MNNSLPKILAVVVLIGIAVAAFYFLSSSEVKSNKRDVEPEHRTVETQSLIFGDHTLLIDGNGIVESQKTLNVISEVNGQVTFVKNDLKSGTYVNKDEIIVKVDSREIENELQSLRSEFMNSIASVLPDLKFEDKDAYDKWYKYFSEININEELDELPEISSNQEKIKISSRNIFTRYYNIRNREIQYSKYSIKAPFAGYVKSEGLLEESFVTRGQQLFILRDSKNLEVTVPLLVEEFNNIDFGYNPRVKIYSEKNPEEYLYGRVVRKETSLERNSQTLNVYVNFNNANLNTYLLPGNYVHVEIEGKDLSNVALLPRHTVDQDGFIYTMEDGKLNRRNVDVAAIQNNLAVIKKTVPEGLDVVTTILQKPLIGMQIKSSTKKENPEGVASQDTGNTRTAASVK